MQIRLLYLELRRSNPTVYLLLLVVTGYCPLLYCILIPFPPFPQGIHTEYIKNRITNYYTPGLLTLQSPYLFLGFGWSDVDEHSNKLSVILFILSPFFLSIFYIQCIVFSPITHNTYTYRASREYVYIVCSVITCVSALIQIKVLLVQGHQEQNCCHCQLGLGREHKTNQNQCNGSRKNSVPVTCALNDACGSS